MSAQVERPVLVRTLDSVDLDSMVELERRCYLAPWSRAMLRNELTRPDGIRIGAFNAGALVGHLIASNLAGTWHVMNVAVDPADRRRGIASTLLEELFYATAGRDEYGFTLEVRVSNHAAINLYQRLGFVSRGVRPRYYVDNGEDAVIMWRPPQSVVDARRRGGDVEWEPPS